MLMLLLGDTLAFIKRYLKCTLSIEMNAASSYVTVDRSRSLSVMSASIAGQELKFSK